MKSADPTVIPRDDVLIVPSVQSLHHTFQNFRNNNIISSIDYFPTKRLYYFHNYSYPYKWTFYDNINLNFPGGLYTYVRKISLYDERPFEHDFFLRIVQSFPFIKKIKLHNDEPQQNVNQQHCIIKYNYLMELNLARAHENYIEQFLKNTKTCLLNDIYLCVDYDSLEKVTDNFTKDETRINCLKIIRLRMCARTAEIRKAKDYFPRTQFYSFS